MKLNTSIWIKYLNFTLLLSVMSLLSCQKASPTDCFKSTGKDITISRSASYFNKIVLEDNINLVITQANNYALEITGGENLLEKVETNIEEETLTIRNTNSCNWMRNFDREITVYADVEIISTIDYMGSGDIRTTNTLSGDSLILNVWEGAGRVDMDIHMQRNYIYFHIGTADIYYKGYSHLSYITASSFGPVYAENMQTVFTFINNEGSNNCYVNSDYKLEATIKNLGDIYYLGSPEIILNDTGEGQLLKMEE